MSRNEQKQTDYKQQSNDDDEGYNQPNKDQVNNDAAFARQLQLHYRTQDVLMRDDEILRREEIERRNNPSTSSSSSSVPVNEKPVPLSRKRKGEGEVSTQKKKKKPEQKNETEDITEQKNGSRKVRNALTQITLAIRGIPSVEDLEIDTHTNEKTQVKKGKKENYKNNLLKLPGCLEGQTFSDLLNQHFRQSAEPIGLTEETTTYIKALYEQTNTNQNQMQGVLGYGGTYVTDRIADFSVAWDLEYKPDHSGVIAVKGIKAFNFVCLIGGDGKIPVDAMVNGHVEMEKNFGVKTLTNTWKKGKKNTNQTSNNIQWWDKKIIKKITKKVRDKKTGELVDKETEDHTNLQTCIICDSADNILEVWQDTPSSRLFAKDSYFERRSKCPNDVFVNVSQSSLNEGTALATIGFHFPRPKDPRANLCGPIAYMNQHEDPNTVIVRLAGPDNSRISVTSKEIREHRNTWNGEYWDGEIFALMTIRDVAPNEELFYAASNDIPINVDKNDRYVVREVACRHLKGLYVTDHILPKYLALTNFWNGSAYTLRVVEDDPTRVFALEDIPENVYICNFNGPPVSETTYKNRHKMSFDDEETLHNFRGVSYRFIGKEATRVTEAHMIRTCYWMLEQFRYIPTALSEDQQILFNDLIDKIRELEGEHIFRSVNVPFKLRVFTRILIRSFLCLELKQITPTVTAPKQITPIVSKQITPTVSKQITPIVSKQITPTVSKQITPTVSKQITPTVSKQITPTVTAPKQITPTATAPKQITPTATTPKQITSRTHEQSTATAPKQITSRTHEQSIVTAPKQITPTTPNTTKGKDVAPEHIKGTPVPFDKETKKLYHQVITDMIVLSSFVVTLNTEQIIESDAFSQVKALRKADKDNTQAIMFVIHRFLMKEMPKWQPRIYAEKALKYYIPVQIAFAQLPEVGEIKLREISNLYNIAAHSTYLDVSRRDYKNYGVGISISWVTKDPNCCLTRVYDELRNVTHLVVKSIKPIKYGEELKLDSLYTTDTSIQITHAIARQFFDQFPSPILQVRLDKNIWCLSATKDFIATNGPIKLDINNDWYHYFTHSDTPNMQAFKQADGTYQYKFLRFIKADVVWTLNDPEHLSASPARSPTHDEDEDAMADWLDRPTNDKEATDEEEKFKTLLEDPNTLLNALGKDFRDLLTKLKTDLIADDGVHFVMSTLANLTTTHNHGLAWELEEDEEDEQGDYDANMGDDEERKTEVVEDDVDSTDYSSDDDS